MVHRSESELILDNIIFRNRNQSYGAYEIRNVYNSHLKTAAFLAFAVFSLAVISPKIAKLLGAGDDVKISPLDAGGCEYVLEDIPFETPLPHIPDFRPQVASSVAFPHFRIIEDDRVINEAVVATQDELKKSNPGSESLTGEPGAEPGITVAQGAGSGHESVSPEPMEPFVYIPEAPKFKGDYMGFIGANTQYPKAALEENIEGKVHLQFIIEKDGSVSDLKVIKPLGYGCDEEAIRVIKMTSGMWTAPQNNGIAVRYKKSIALSFVIPKNSN